MLMMRGSTIAFLAALGTALSGSPGQAGGLDRYGAKTCCADYQHDWSGLYVGGHAGAAYAQIEWSFVGPTRS
jgi:hypothetical protein